MGDLVNLRRVRKAKVRTAVEAEAQANRAMFGRAKSERAHAEAERDLAARRLDGHVRASSDAPAPRDD